MINKNLTFLFLLILLIFIKTESSKAQFDKIGYPFLKNYDRSEYKAGIQSWMISQAPDGIIYFANNEGLIEFDGLNWQLHPTPDRTIVRSVLAAEDGKIYVGSSNNFGYFERDKHSGLKFHSLLNILPENSGRFDEIWKIHDTEQGIIFQSFTQLIILKNNKTQVIQAPGSFHFSFYVNKKLYVSDNKLGIFELKDNKPVHLPGTEILKDNEICSIISLNGKLLISTTDNGVYTYENETLTEWENETSDFLKTNQIFTAIRINKDYIAFGTIQNGLIISTNDGKPVLNINESNGLQNNTILCLKKDSDNNLWIGTDNGIDLLYINLPLTLLTRWQNISAGYTAAIHKGVLYLGTNRGLFYKNWDKCQKYPSRLSNFQLIEEVKGQVWKLQVIDDRLFCGHNNGTYIIEGNTAKKISDIQGAWTFLHHPQKKDKIICGTYTGLILFEKKNGAWEFSKKIKGFDESSRIMELDNLGNIWMSHGFKGAFLLKLNNSVDSISSIKFYNSKKGFKTDYGVNAVKIKNQIVFLTPDGVYQHNLVTDRMEKSQYFDSLLNRNGIDYAVESANGDIWYFSNKKIAVKRLQEDGNYSEINLPFKSLEGMFIGGFEFVYPINSSHILIGYENGFINYDQTQITNYKKNFNVFLSQVKLSRSDSILFKGHLSKDCEEKIEIDYKNNSLHFFFSAVSFDNPEKNKFSTFLMGYDKTWSAWENRLDREFTNLPEGDYAFYVKARNIYDTETKPMIFKFTVKPPWTRTKTAFVIYALLILSIIVLVFYIVLRRIEYVKLREERIQSQKFIEREKELQREALIAEKELIKLRNDKLRLEMKTKNKELADSTMQKIQKNKFLINLKNDLTNLSTISNKDSINIKVKKIISKIDNDINNENNWKIFEKHFSNVHEEFLTRLKNEYPEISSAELRLCACLRMNISTKEIASLLNISVRGVEATRYRLRKTLDLDRKINLTDFILSY